MPQVSALGILPELAAKHPEVANAIVDAIKSALKAKSATDAWQAAVFSFLKSAEKKLAHTGAAATIKVLRGMVRK